MSEYSDEIDHSCVLCAARSPPSFPFGAATSFSSSSSPNPCKEHEAEWPIAKKVLEADSIDDRKNELEKVQDKPLRITIRRIIDRTCIRKCVECKELRNLAYIFEEDPEEICDKCTDFHSTDLGMCLTCERELPCARAKCAELAPKVKEAILALSKFDPEVRDIAYRALDEFVNVCPACKEITAMPDHVDICARCRVTTATADHTKRKSEDSSSSSNKKQKTETE